MRSICLMGLVVALLMPVTSHAQPLVESIPADAMVYIAWQGRDELGDAYEQSHLKPVIDASRFPELIIKFMPALMQRIGRDERDAKPVLDLISTLAEPTFRYSTAIYFAGMDTTNPDMPLPRLAMLIHARGQAPALAGRIRQRLDAIAQNSGLPPGLITTAEQDGMVMVAVGTPIAEGSLANNDHFTAAMAKVPGDAVIAAYIDAEAVLNLVDHLVQTYEPNDLPDWTRVRDAINLGGIHRIAYSGGFDGRNWADRLFIAAPAPRTGIAMLFDSQPLDQQFLRFFPQDATVVFAGRFDLATLLQEAQQAITRADQPTGERMDNGLLELNEALGIHLQNDLLEPLGDHWGFYISPTVGGDSMLGFALVNRLDDAQKVDQALATLAQRASQALEKESGPNVTVRFKQTEIDGIGVHYLAIPLVAPSWTVHDGTLYVGLYPQVVVAAAQHDAGGGNIVDNPQYQEVMGHLGVDQPGTVQFIDMTARVPQGYGAWLAISQLYLGLADMSGLQAPAMVLPPLNVIMRNITPVGGVTWSDDTGYYARSREPFPGSSSLATTDAGTTAIAQQAIALSIMLPSLNRARETANRVKCASNMRQIGQAMLLYANENRQRYPKTLGELVATQDIGTEVFICPSSSNSVPDHIRHAPLDEQAAWVTNNAPYVYLAPPRSNVNPELVMVHEKLDNHDHDGINMLFGDGHVEFMQLELAMELIERSRAAFQAAQ